MSEQLIEFSWWPDAPSIYATETQLKQAGLKPGGPVVARVSYGRGRKAREYLLYDGRHAVPRQQATLAQLAALEQARIARCTCFECGKVVETPSQLNKRKRCADCVVATTRLNRARRRDETILWARELMRRDDWLILDTETTGLGECYLVEIGIVASDGSTVFESLVEPWKTIDPGAEFVHGITRDMLKGAPTFADIEPQLRTILHGKTVVVYNASFDADVLEREVARLIRPRLRQRGWFGDGYYTLSTLAGEQANWWTNRITWSCAMEKYAQFVGEWHDYYKSYRWQPLPGAGHRAVGDCLACLDLIQRMAAAPLSWDVPLP